MQVKRDVLVLGDDRQPLLGDRLVAVGGEPGRAVSDLADVPQRPSRVGTDSFSILSFSFQMTRGLDLDLGALLRELVRWQMNESP